MPYIVEVCVDSLESALQADAGGCDRIELCAGLSEGGLTPSYGLIAAVCKSVKCVVHVLIRPRPGDFIYTQQELDIMRADILQCSLLGAHGVVLGVLRPDATVDTDHLRQFVDLCTSIGCDLTFHRAFDTLHNQRRGLQDLISCNVPRVLTSGGATNAMEGLEQIAELVKEGQGRIQVICGAGINPENCIPIVRYTGVSEVHGTFRTASPSQLRWIHPRVHFAPCAFKKHYAGRGGGTANGGGGDDDSSHGGGGMHTSDMMNSGQGDREHWTVLVTDSEIVRAVRAQLNNEEEDSAMG